jgi:hypothetical protein
MGRWASPPSGGMDDDAVGDDDDVAVRISVSQIRVTAEDCGRSEEPLPNVTRAFSIAN